MVGKVKAPFQLESSDYISLNIALNFIQKAILSAHVSSTL